MRRNNNVHNNKPVQKYQTTIIQSTFTSNSNSNSHNKTYYNRNMQHQNYNQQDKRKPHNSYGSGDGVGSRGKTGGSSYFTRQGYNGGKRNNQRRHYSGGHSVGRVDETLALNFGNIQGMDRNITKIIDSSTQVAIFKYLEKGWDDASAVGSLFVYERSTTPKIGLFVMNRVSAQNWIHCLTEQCEIVIKFPYLMIKDHECIICIWFYDANDCTKLAMTLQRFGYTTLSEPDSKATNKSNTVVGAAGGNALLQMLTNSEKAKSDNSGANILAQLIATQEKKNSILNALVARAGAHEDLVHPSAVKVELLNRSATDSESKPEIASSSSSFAAFTSNSNAKQRNFIIKKLGELDAKGLNQAQSNNETTRASSGENYGFMMQTVEQLEKGTVSTDTVGSGSDTDVNGLSDAIKTPLDDTQIQMALSNDLRKKLGITSKNESKVGEMNVKSTGNSNSGSDDNNIGPSVSNQASPAFATPNEFLQSSNWESFNSPSLQPSTNVLGLPSGITSTSTPCRIPTIDDLHGRTLDDVEPEELELVLSHHPGKISDLILLAKEIPGSNESQLTWTNVTRENSKFSMSSHWNSSAPIGFSGRTMSETGKLGVNDLPLTADQLIKTFQILLRDEEFVRKFHNAYLKVRSEEGF